MLLMSPLIVLDCNGMPVLSPDSSNPLPSTVVDSAIFGADAGKFLLWSTGAPRGEHCLFLCVLRAHCDSV